MKFSFLEKFEFESDNCFVSITILSRFFLKKKNYKKTNEICDMSIETALGKNSKICVLLTERY